MKRFRMNDESSPEITHDGNSGDTPIEITQLIISRMNHRTLLEKIRELEEGTFNPEWADNNEDPFF